MQGRGQVDLRTYPALQDNSVLRVFGACYTKHGKTDTNNSSPDDTSTTFLRGKLSKACELGLQTAAAGVGDHTHLVTLDCHLQTKRVFVV